ncbi:MAG: EthD domain-containing protein [Dehalococcoidia bacterium]|nr:EthD domain-containing protein [Dehalococcoidia bacterium]
MVKLVFCLRRRPELTREEFQRYWYDNHAPLVKSVQDVLGIRRYVQVHTLETGLNAAIQASRGGPEGYDGVAELWYDSLDAIGGNRSEEARAAAQLLLEDERKFIDLANSPLWFAEEKPIIG